MSNAQRDSIGRASTLSATVDDPRAPAIAPDTRRRLESYLERLYQASGVRNLTKVPRDQAWARHIEESLSLVPLRPWRTGELVVDLGSGGGIPGIPLALALPGLRFVLVERSEAKAAWLRTAVAELGLGEVTVVARDARELGRGPDRIGADVLVSRAAAPLPRLLPLVQPLLLPGGEALLIVGASAVASPQLAQLCRRAQLGPPEIVVSQNIRVLRVRRPEPPAFPPSTRLSPPGPDPRRMRPRDPSSTG